MKLSDADERTIDHGPLDSDALGLGCRGSLMINRLCSSFAGRLFFYLIATIPAIAAITILAVAKLPAVSVGFLSASAALAMAIMWWLFSTNTSSTSSQVFLWGWFAGVPSALAIRIGAGRRTRSMIASIDLPG
ncbi:MAG: hypothetical protein ACI8RE_002613 [Ilumatobacter sp.]|jgi:hypothetical protein